MYIIKRNGSRQEFNPNKINKAINSALQICNCSIENPSQFIEISEGDSVEVIQDRIENYLMSVCKDAAKAFILYRERHKNLRDAKERAEYIEHYIAENDNAATGSEVDDNANIQNKNVATLEAEIHKSRNIEISRYRVTKKLQELYGVDAPNYIKDLESHIIYKHDESSAPAIKPYCVAVSLYPFLLKGTSTLDKLYSSAPTNLQAFCGQFNNLVFLLSSQFQGAVAFGEFFNVFYYYCVKDFGEEFWKYDEEIVYHTKNKQKTISDMIEQSFQNIVYSINQPAGNRSYQSPFSNISYYDSNYWHALFDEFVFPDGTKPSWEGIDYLQRKFMRWFNKERSKTLLTFPVETMALLTDGKDVLDKSYKDFTAEMYAEGHSFFTYLSDNPNGLASCCRLRNGIEKNEFSFTSGLTGVATGSKSVITLNINRIVQNFDKEYHRVLGLDMQTTYIRKLEKYIINILERVYKYHTAYNELLKDLYKHNMLPVYSEGYINLNQQFLTIGINGINEAAIFLGMKCSYNEEYKNFCRFITEIISKENKKHRTKELKFNCEFVPAEGLGIKNYNWDKADGYVVPEGRNCYTSYFYMPDDPNISVLDKFRMQGKEFTELLDGGVANHVNLEEHLSKKQYEKLIDFSIQEGCTYFTFNVPNSQCDDCGFISKHKIIECPKCKSNKITWWTRIIGYLRPIKAFSKGRRIEANKRIYNA